MPKLLANSYPSYRRHKQSGQGIVTLNGRDFLLGTHGSAASKAEYTRLIAEWVANDRQLPRERRGGGYGGDGLTVNELILAYWRFAKTYYVKNGRATSEVHSIKSALAPLKKLYGTTAARDFRPLALQAVRERMIDNGWARGTVNDQVARIKRMFKWAVARELVPPELHHGLTTVEGLRRGRTAARETPPVKPVAREHVLAVIGTLSPSLAKLLDLQEQPPPPPDRVDAVAGEARRLAAAVPAESPVAAMVAVEWLAGMRPGELVTARGCDIDTSAKVWIYRPSTHKTEHFDQHRTVPLGPRAQQILRPFLRPDATRPLFSPADAMLARRQRRRAVRQGKVPPSQVDRRRPHPRRPPGDRYDTGSYRRAVAYACRRAGVPVWTPNQLRHSCGTNLRHRFGLEAARVVLGHSSVETTQIYAERDGRVAAEVMSQVG